MVNRVAAFCQMAKTPIICDADTGYGGLLNVAHTVRGYEAAGAAPASTRGSGVSEKSAGIRPADA